MAKHCKRFADALRSNQSSSKMEGYESTIELSSQIWALFFRSSWQGLFLEAAGKRFIDMVFADEGTRHHDLYSPGCCQGQSAFGRVLKEDIKVK
jgi:hypothetical protein